MIIAYIVPYPWHFAVAVFYRILFHQCKWNTNFIFTWSMFIDSEVQYQITYCIDRIIGIEFLKLSVSLNPKKLMRIIITSNVNFKE